jgi:hypothetical protein
MSTISHHSLSGGTERPDGGRLPYPSHSTGPQITTVPHRHGPQRASEVLQLEGKYIHCGEPMWAAEYGLRDRYAPMTTERISPEQTSKGVLEVYLCTRVLHCLCGFQMEMPDYT